MTDVGRIVSENRRAVWILAAGLALNIVLYAAVVYPLSGRVQSEQEQAGQATTELVAAQRAYAAARGTVTGKRQADEELDRFYRDVLPSDLSGARRTLFPNVERIARGANLTLYDSQIAPEPAGDGELRKLTITLNLAGEYDDIRRFIHELETAPEFLALESLSVTQIEEGERALNVTARVATYYRHAAHGT